MNRRHLAALLLLALACPAHSAAGRAAPVRVSGAGLRLGASPVPVINAPAQLGGSGVLGPITAGVPSMSPSAKAPSATPGISAPSAIPAAASAKAEAAALPSAPEASAPGALQSAAQLGEAVSKESAQSAGADVSRVFFDGGNNNNGGDGVGGGGGGGGSNDDNNGGRPLNQLYPRVVFLQDVFTRPASEATVAYLEKLADAGVHLVFLTSRPLKGPGSADEILLSRLKFHRTNPIVVVSYNGGKVSLHGKAANPASILEDVGYFTASDLESLEKAAQKAAKGAGLEALVTASLPAKESAFTFTAALPASVSDADAPAARASLIKRMNTALKNAKLPYTVAAHPDDARAVVAHSMPLRFSLPRVMQALQAQFQGEELEAAKFLIIADSRKSPKFSSAFPRQAEVQVAGDGSGVETVLGAVLGDRSLPTVSLKLGKLRQYVEYWEPSHRRSFVDYEPGMGGGGSTMRGGDREMNQKFAMYTGTVLYQLMAWWYEQVFRGQHKFAGLGALQGRLREMWYKPMKYGVYVNKPLAKAMASPAWKAMQRGYLEYANSFLTNYYMREFGDYSTGARDVQMNMVGLATDRKSLITLEFVSASTGKMYKIHTRIPRVMKLDTSEGRTLTAHSYRTGKETPDDGEEFLARILAMALLKGHGRKGTDGKWHHGSPDGEVLAKLKVQLEYRSSHRTWVFDTSDFLRLQEDAVVSGPIVQEITSAIEREEADAEYQAYYAEQEQQASKDDLKKKKAPAKKTPAKKTAAKPAAKTRRGA